MYRISDHGKHSEKGESKETSPGHWSPLRSDQPLSTDRLPGQSQNSAEHLGAQITDNGGSEPCKWSQKKENYTPVRKK